jgi:outer membrane protein assembly factor BamB
MRRRIALVGFAVALAGCSGGGAKPPATATGSGWIRTDLTPVAQPYIAGGRFVVYVQGSAGLDIVGLDAKTGRTAWKLDASASGVTQGIAPIFAIDGNRVVFLRDVGKGSAALVAVDARTGALSWNSPPGIFADWAATCADDTTAVCTTGFLLGKPQQARELRFAAATGKQLPSPSFPAGSSPRSLAPDLYDLGTRKPEKFAATSGDKIMWQRPLASVFTSAGASTDNGWNIDRVPKAGMFVGSVMAAPVSSSPTSAVFDLSKTMTAGIRMSDGSAAWRDLGSQYACSDLPCPGMVLDRAKGTPAYAPPTQGLRLRLRGIARVSKTNGPTFSNFDVVVEGFDLRTGMTRWSFDAGPSQPLLENASLPSLAENTIVVKGADRKLIALNVRNGARTPVPPGAIAWCAKPTRYTTDVPDGQSPTTSYQGDDALLPCDTTGATVTTPKQVPRFVGPLLDGVVAWSEAHQVVARPPAG